MNIRRFEDKDAEALSQLVIETFKEFNAVSFEEQGVEKFLEHHQLDYFKKKVKEGDVFVAEVNGEIVGTVAGNGKDKINNLFVRQDYQDQGLGKKLLRRIEELYKEKGANKIRVWSSLQAVDFYENQGYKKSRGIVKNKKGFVYQPMIKEF